MAERKAAATGRQISVSTVACDGYSMEEAFEILAGCGAEAVEPAYIEGYVDFEESSFSSANARNLRTRLADCGMTSPTVSAHIDLGAPDAAHRLNRRIQFAADLGAATLITNFTTIAKLDAAMASIDENIDELDRLGLSLAIENPGHGRDAALYDAASIRSVVDAFSHPRLRCNFDICNMYTYHMGNTDPFAELRAVSGRCKSVHLKNVKQERGGWSFVDLADGELDYGAPRRFLEDLAHDVVLVIEHPLRMFRPSRRDPVRTSGRAESTKINAAIVKSLGFLNAMSRGRHFSDADG